MPNEIVFQLGSTGKPCVSIIEKTTKVRMGEHDHLLLTADPANKGPITLFFDSKAALDTFESPPKTVILLPKAVSDAGLTPKPVDRLKLKFRKDMDLPRNFKFETEPKARCGGGDVTDVVVEC